MAPSLVQPITLDSQLVPKTMEDLLDGMDKATTPQWFYELEQAYQFMPAEEWPRVLEEYKTGCEKEIELRCTGGKWKSVRSRLMDAWGGLIPHGITFDDPASPSNSNSTAEASRSSAPSNQPPPDFSPLATETEQSPSAPPRSSFALPASLQTKLLPPSLSDLLLGLDQASTLPWSDELEKIYQLIPESNWKQLEADYEELIRRVCAARSEGRSEAWKQLQEALFAARRNIMHVHSLRNRHQQHARFELAASSGKSPLQLSAKLSPLATLLSLEEKRFFAGYGIDLSIPSSRPRSPSPHPPFALEHPHQPSIAPVKLQVDLKPSTDEPLIEFD
ncbi:hypothetical protein BCR35DRAFT_305954 [Leucosporidium creatinivorum]|uniref:Uncharacterized protein n=1 Tax=Leucosporidium creatinivorum TaxID=106004 RepID=A0A1Y2EXG9_9BASI|nr:hypothetical protein BCR35DRAFT_305954 [Leucosporidium creatinivorum]